MEAAVTFVAKYFIVLSVLMVVWLFLKQSPPKKKEFIVVAVVGALLSLLLAKTGGQLYYHPRPFIEGNFTPYFPHGNDNGFPSDHTLLAGFLAFLAFYYSRKFGWTLLVLALLIGLSRVVAGVHHLTDIIGSLIFSGVSVWVAVLIVRKITDKTQGAKAADRHPSKH